MAECQGIEVYKPAKPPDLNARLKEEQGMLEKYFCPEKYPILYENDTPCFEREVKIKEDRIYILRVYVNDQYPQQLPDLVVFISPKLESPEPMPHGPDWSGSHDTHTYPRMHGFLRICHWHWAAWKTENMIYQVFNKGEEWLQAYEKYRITKKLPLELKQMELTEEETQKVAEQQLQQLVLSQRRAEYQMYRLHPNLLNQLWIDIWYTFGITSDILSQTNLPSVLPVLTADDKSYIQRLSTGHKFALQRVNEGPDGMMLPQLIRLECALKECKAVWPNWLIVILKFVSARLMMELRVYWRNMYMRPRNSPPYS